ncbi:MAG: hypothetical protein JRJ47_13275, partial [Deltaproteobacteria bacterium]|nr:hypothetical protein [Deltaproteobacteria bacterium]
WLLAGHSVVRGARVAGEEGVTPAAPEAAQPPPEQPPAVTPPEQPSVVGPPEPAPPPERRVQRPTPPPPDKRVERPAPPPEIRERPRPTPAPAEETPDERYVTIDFDDVDIALLIKFISELTGKNFVVDKAVRGKVTIISPTKISGCSGPVKEH